MKTINEQLDKELFKGYYYFHLPRLHFLRHLPLPLRLRPRLLPRLCPHFENNIINKLDILYIGWEYGNSVFNMI